MVLSKNEINAQLSKIFNNQHDYMVLDTSKLPYRENSMKFTYAIEVLNLINYVHWMNKLSRNLNSDIYINTDILHQAIDSLFSDKKFTDDQLETYFKTTFEIQEFDELILNFTEREAYVPFELEFSLFGLYPNIYVDLIDDDKEELQLMFSEVLINKDNIKLSIQNFKKIISEFSTRKEPILN